MGQGIFNRESNKYDLSVLDAGDMVSGKNVKVKILE
jgi:hypothetical protein